MELRFSRKQLHSDREVRQVTANFHKLNKYFLGILDSEPKKIGAVYGAALTSSELRYGRWRSSLMLATTGCLPHFHRSRYSQ
jgi:hypothetical protein